MARTTIGALLTLLAFGAAACGGDRIAAPSGIESVAALSSVTSAEAPIAIGPPGYDDNQSGWICYRRIVTGVDDGGAMSVSSPPRSIIVDDIGDRCPEGFDRMLAFPV